MACANRTGVLERLDVGAEGHEGSPKKELPAPWRRPRKRRQSSLRGTETIPATSGIHPPSVGFMTMALSAEKLRRQSQSAPQICRSPESKHHKLQWHDLVLGLACWRPPGAVSLAFGSLAHACIKVRLSSPSGLDCGRAKLRGMQSDHRVNDVTTIHQQ